MERASNVRTSSGMVSALLVGFTLLGAAGCGEEADKVETRQSAVVTWTNLQLLNGWQSYGTGYTPAVAIINGTVTFRGALKAPTSTTNQVAFRLDPAPFSAFQTVPADNTIMRTVMSGNVGGHLYYRAQEDEAGIHHNVYVIQDGTDYGVVGSAAKAFTSLDGVAFDQAPSTPLVYNYDHWESKYGFRQDPVGGVCAGLQDCGVFATLLNGFVHFQGALKIRDIDNVDGYIFTLPSSSLIPGQMVTVPVSLGGDSPPNQTLGTLTIYPDGNVYMNGSTWGAFGGLSFEGVAYSKTTSGTVALPLENGWTAYSPRQVKVGNFGGVVRFQGAIKNGTNATITTNFPTSLRPSRTIRLTAAASGPWPAFIVVTPGGTVTVQTTVFSYAQTYLTLDGLSFPL